MTKTKQVLKQTVRYKRYVKALNFRQNDENPFYFLVVFAYSININFPVFVQINQIFVCSVFANNIEKITLRKLATLTETLTVRTMRRSKMKCLILLIDLYDY